MQTSQTASILFDDKRCQSIDIEVSGDNNEFSLDAFDLMVKFLNSSTVLDFKKYGISISIDF
jgi:hypothetical protein